MFFENSRLELRISVKNEKCAPYCQETRVVCNGMAAILGSGAGCRVLQAAEAVCNSPADAEGVVVKISAELEMRGAR